MKSKKIIFLCLGIAAFLISQASWGDGFHRARLNFYFDVPLGSSFGSPYYYPYSPAYPYYPSPYPYYYDPRAPIIVEPAPPTQYIEREETLAPGYWYYCGDPQGYYPNVRRCFESWQRIAPQPQ